MSLLTLDQLPLRLACRSAASALALTLAGLYAPTDCVVVISGETGSGKTRLASAIHRTSPRSADPLVISTAMEITESLGQSQLFGHEAGAFTDATARMAGLLERAGSGTLVLDDFHLMPIPIQAMLLRALGSATFLPMGGKRDLPVRCRVIVCMRVDPDILMAEGGLLPDLRYRLGYLNIHIPGLAERRDEIGFFAELFLQSASEVTGVKGPRAFAPDVLPVMEAAPWPGNVRELKASIEAAFVHAGADSLIRFHHLPKHLQVPLRFEAHGDPAANARAMEWALARTKNQAGRAARLLGVHRNTLSKYLATKRAPSSI